MMQKAFWDYLFNTSKSGGVMNWQMGRAMAYAKDEMAPTINWTRDDSHGSFRCAIEAFLLFGDPAQRIKCPDGVPPTIKFKTKPGLYVFDHKILPLKNIFAIGPLTLKANVTDASGVDEVIFTIDGVDYNITSPYEYKYHRFSLLPLGHKLVITASDKIGNQGSSPEITFRMWL
jgi:hypothetical protein